MLNNLKPRIRSHNRKSIVVVLMLMGITFFIYSAISSEGRGSFLGNESAPIAIEVYQDLKCGMCRYAFREAIKEIIEKDIPLGDVKLVFKEFPLGMRREEVELAKAVNCAGEQDRYYDYLKFLYTTEEKLDSKNVVNYAQELKLDINKFTECFSSVRANEKVIKDYEEGQRLGVEGTPTFFINGKKIVGAQPYSKLKSVVTEFRSILYR